MLIIAHRGASGYCKDNSYEAIYKAIEMKSDMIEIDIRLTKDNVCVLYHDPIITTNHQTHTIDEVMYSDLPTDVVQLDELLTSTNDDIQYYLDIKCSDSNTQQFITALEIILKKHTKKHFTVASFCTKFIQDFNVATNNYELAMIYNTLQQNDIHILNDLIPRIKYIIISITNIIDQTDQTDQTDQIKNLFDVLKKIQSNIQIFIYTINNIDVLEHLHTYLISCPRSYINGIITDVPDIISSYYTI